MGVRAAEAMKISWGVKADCEGGGRKESPGSAHPDCERQADGWKERTMARERVGVRERSRRERGRRVRGGKKLDIGRLFSSFDKGRVDCGAPASECEWSRWEVRGAGAEEGRERFAAKLERECEEEVGLKGERIRWESWTGLDGSRGGS